jgi:hypothetical protein
MLRIVGQGFFAALPLCVFALTNKTASTPMTENEIAAITVDVAYQIHKQLGPGLLESVCEAIMAYEIRKRGFHVSQQQALPGEALIKGGITRIVNGLAE